MDVKIDFLLFTILLTLCLNSEQYDNLKFTVVSTTEAPSSPSPPDHQLEIQKTLVETNRRIEEVEVKLTQIQKSLETLLKLHGVKQGENISAEIDVINLSKIGQVVEEKLRLHKSCDNINNDINNKLEKIKQDLINEIDEKHNEQTKSSVANLEQVKQDIVAHLNVEINTRKEAIDALGKKLDSINNQFENVTKEIVKFESKLEEQLEEKRKVTTVVPVKDAKNCKKVFEQGNVQSGIYTIKPTDSAPFEVLCDMDTKGGGWTYFMRRLDGSQDFYLNWTYYKEGFGNLKGEFWLGLEHLHELTGSYPNELLFVLTDWDGKTVYSHFKKFSIGNEKENYELKTIDGYSGDGGKSFMKHLHRKFSTLDKQDAYGHCVKTYHGPWWYGPGCFHVKLTGKYLKGKIQSYADGVHSSEFHGYRYSLKEVKMMVRP